MNEPQARLCVLFGDVAGSTRLYERLGDAAALQAVESCLEQMRRAVAAQGGRVVKTIGDEVMAVFETAEAGLRAAQDMQQRIDGLAPVAGTRLAVRIGLHCGPVLQENGDVFGDTVNTAARMTDLAKGGQIITTGESVAALPPVLRSGTRDIDTLTVKGKADGVQVCEVLWQENADLTMMSPGLSSVPAANARLRLRHRAAELVLGPLLTGATLGRDVQCDLVIHDPKASRTHGRIELRRDKFVLVDQSSNGTYVSFEGEPEFVLRREEIMLRGRGRVVFGHGWAPDVAEVLEFAVEG